ncbi:MAG: DUF805 domain-containing protein [Chlamydiales bacterium]|nr:DUF805 domain-containing protein [Chlamydiales bacterium]
MKKILSYLAKNYSIFSGRAGRKEFLLYHLMMWGFFLMIAWANNMIAVHIFHSFVLARVVSLLIGMAALALVVPTLGITVRRIHDIGRNGWWILLTLIPYLGLIFTLILFVKKGQLGENQYGQNPLKEAVIA